MEKIDEFSVYTFSNASTEINLENTLTHYVNNLPYKINLPINENWFVCVESVGFPANFETSIPLNDAPNIVVSTTNTDYNKYFVESEPIIGIGGDILSPLEGVVAGSFGKKKKNSPIYVVSDTVAVMGKFIAKYYPEETAAFVSKYDNEKEDAVIHVEYIKFPKYAKLKLNLIEDSLKELDRFDIGYNYDMTSENYLSFYKKTGSKKIFRLSFHEDTAFYFQLPINEMVHVRLFEQNYYSAWLSYENPAILGNTKNWIYHFPEVIKIECGEICEQIYNNQFTKDMNIFFPHITKNTNFFFHEFLDRQYVKLTNLEIDKLSIVIKDNKNKKLALTKGIASFVKLNFKKMPLSYDCFNVRISSENSKGSFFTCTLPRTYYLDSNWKVSLTSINFPNNIKPLTEDIEQRTIYARKTSLDKQNTEFCLEGKNADSRALIFENLMWTTSTFLAKINDELENFIHLDISKELICKLTILPETILVIPNAILEVIGYDISNSSEFVMFCTNNNACIIYNSSTSNQIIKMTNVFNINALKPLYMMLYTDFIRPSIVGTSYSKLLKIVQIPNTDANYYTEEFQNQETHYLENTLLKSVHFEIRSHTGELINFADNSPVFINLLFQKVI